MDKQLNYKLFDSGIYPIRLIVVRVEEDENLENWQKVFTIKSKISLQGNDAITFPVLLTQEQADAICILLRGEQPDNVWAHEAVHAADMIELCLGIGPDLENDEAHAYLIEWIFSQIKNFVNN